MKKILAVAIVSICTSSLFAQDVPSEVSKAFKTKFPTIKEVEWMEGEDGYDADFYVGNENKLASFDGKGNWLQTQTTLEEDKYPAVITKAVKAKYAGAEIESVQMIETKSETFYNVNAGNSKASYTIKLDKTGKILSSEEFSNDDDGGYEDEE